ncbi:hypothetical protein A1O7_06731 [Cladophialophora yegresii CBS 114405]|uniref:Uncharacterized protein n=1 Tax=Cladophialophora yegresii CBS 114405 TaxID=1182544 RepID=W9VLK8_9EURO|nr:uncharacterized protein A1O7_06731 [Cladophialophora yegresii CBS 114405]EXJ56388.1 hypothetical protein A1O7_06731 [Cladophialophora yegresii CBS 114405]
MDAETSPIQEFYGCLVLLRLLTPNRSSIQPDKPSAIRVPKRNKWHVFLDSLAWLADHKCGGKTVTAVAVGLSSTGPIYWIVSQSPIDPEVLRHVQKVLVDLSHESPPNTSSPLDLIRQIARDSIEISGLRVRNYGQRLKAIVAAVDAKEPLVALDEGERQHLKSFLNLSRDPDRLIDLSLKLKRSRLLKRLHHLIQASEEKALWVEVRHLLGRLCSWVRAATRLVLTCQRFRDRIRNARVEPVDLTSIGTFSFQLPWHEPVDILRELMPEFHGSRLRDALHARQNDKMVGQILRCLSTMERGRFHTDLHVEVILLRHFHLRRLDFIADDRYIGCSKPSCYCCDLYLRSHPVGVQPRRSHGNVWIKWATPLFSGVPTADEVLVLQDIVNTVKSDLRFQIISSPTLTRRPPDSTTGLESTNPLSSLD